MPTAFTSYYIALSKIKQQSHTFTRTTLQFRYQSTKQSIHSLPNSLSLSHTLRIMPILRVHTTIRTARKMRLADLTQQKRSRNSLSRCLLICRDTRTHSGMCKYRKVTRERIERKSVAVFRFRKKNARLTHRKHKHREHSVQKQSWNIYGIKSIAFQMYMF